MSRRLKKTPEAQYFQTVYSRLTTVAVNQLGLIEGMGSDGCEDHRSYQVLVPVPVLLGARCERLSLLFFLL